MQYRKFGGTGVEVSALGFGCMRFPTREDKTVDEERAIRMVRAGIEGGVSYVDTAYNYHGGQSEQIVGRALADGYRDKVSLATKCPVWLVEKEGDFERLLEEQLSRLQTDVIDFYLLHALNKDRLEQKVKKFHLVERALEARKKGKIRFLGFSFHDSLEVFEEILNYTDQWDFCQIQYNYIDLEGQPGVKGLKLAAEKGLGVVVMEPLLGGKLANLAPHVETCLKGDKTAVEYAFDFLWDQPEVSLLLSGMSGEEQVEANLAYADKSFIGMVREEERPYYREAKRIFDKMALVNCTGCGYCMPCASGLDIPGIFAVYNQSAVDEEQAKKAYEALDIKADKCQTCKTCEEACPQHIAISERMRQAAQFFAGE